MGKDSSIWDESLPLPWRLQHMNGLLVGGLFFIFFAAILIALLLIFGRNNYSNTALYSIIWLSLYFIFSVFGVFLLNSYRVARKFDGILKALNVGPCKIEFKEMNTMEINSLYHGTIWLRYVEPVDDSPSYYKLWISSKKDMPKQYFPHRYIWQRRSLLEKLSNKPKPRWDEIVPGFSPNAIKSLSSIMLESGHFETRIIAYLDDKWLYSETKDILHTIGILKEIERRI